MNAELMAWAEHAPDELVLAFDQYLARFTSVELENYGAVLTTLVFSERVVLVNRFDLWQKELEVLFPNLAEEIVQSWLALEDTDFSSMPTVSPRSQRLLRVYRALLKLLAEPTPAFITLCPPYQRDSSVVVGLTLDIIETMNRDLCCHRLWHMFSSLDSQTGERIQRVLSWVQQAMREGSVDAIGLFKDVVSRRALQKISSHITNCTMRSGYLV